MQATAAQKSRRARENIIAGALPETMAGIDSGPYAHARRLRSKSWRGPFVNRTLPDTAFGLTHVSAPPSATEYTFRRSGDGEIRASPPSGRGAVPRYFFHVHDGEDLLDREGVELPGPVEAREQAI